MKLLQKRLLFVDDEAAIRTTLAAILRRYGFSVTVAATAQEALDHIGAQEFDLLLCDLNLQREADGYAVIRAMREAQPRCVAIVLTGYPGVDSAIEGIHLGIDDYIVKPTSPDVLVALLAEKLIARQPKARILSLSCDETLLRMRHMIFENAGYEVVSAAASAPVLQPLKQEDFDVLVLGYKIPHREKETLAQGFRRSSSGRIISLRSNAGEPLVEGADYHVEADPEPLLKLVAEVTRRASTPRHSGQFNC
ncbi:MAG TPA: response regulator [Terriglobales bacterium]|nr:response regulator [Terriglobales bacterium]